MTRDIIKGAKLFTAALSAIAVFPLIHEGGHAFFTLLAKGEIKGFRLFPVPCILCGVSGLQDFQIAFIASGGIIFSFLFSVLLSFKKPFFLWFFSFCIRVMTVLSLFAALISLLLLPFGIYLEQEDVVSMLSFWNWGFFPLTALLVLLLYCTILMLKRDCFFKRIFKYFELENSAVKLPVSFWESP